MRHISRSLVAVGLVIAFIASFYSTMALSGDFRLPADQKWIQVYSHADKSIAIRRARQLATNFDYAEVFLADTGWYAVVVGVAKTSNVALQIDEFIRAGWIPDDSFAADGESYVASVWTASAGYAASALDEAIAREKSWSKKVKSGVQNALVWSGHYKGNLKGEFGRMTRRAIRDFQRELGATPTGYLTRNEIRELERRRVESVRLLGFEQSKITAAGVRIGIPTAIFGTYERNGFSLVYSAPGTNLSVLSMNGGRAAFDVLFDILNEPAEIGRTPYITKKPDWFVIGEKDGDVYSYAYVTLRQNEVKGFRLAWAPRDDSIMDTVAVAMFNSFEPISGIVLHRFDDQKDYRSSTTSPQTPDRPRDRNDARVEEPTRSSGTGFIVARNGLAVTNAHVVDGCEKLLVDKRHPATVISSDELADLALLKIDRFRGDAVASFSERPARLNTDIVVVGYPLHGILGGLNVTRGNVSAMSGLRGARERFQLTAEIQPGNSGGPVVDYTGSVVGVVQSKLVAKALDNIPQNVNFAIRTGTVKLFLSRLNVEYQINRSRDRLDSADLAAAVAKYTVLIECN